MLIYYYPVVSCLFSSSFLDKMLDNIYSDMYSNNLSMYLSEEKLLLHVSKYYIIFNCESCVYCALCFGHL